MMRKPTSKKMMPAKKAMMGSKMASAPMMKKGGSVKKYPDGGSIRKPIGGSFGVDHMDKKKSPSFGMDHADPAKKRSQGMSDYINSSGVKNPTSNIKPTMRKGGKSMMRKGGKSC
jgi:hypothetical protein